MKYHQYTHCTGDQSILNQKESMHMGNIQNKLMKTYIIIFLVIVAVVIIASLIGDAEDVAAGSAGDLNASPAIASEQK